MPLTNIQTTGQWASASQYCSHPCCGTAQFRGERLSPYPCRGKPERWHLYKYNGLGYWAWFQAVQTPFRSWDLSSLNTENPSPILILLLGVLQNSEFLWRCTKGLYGRRGWAIVLSAILGEVIKFRDPSKYIWLPPIAPCKWICIPLTASKPRQ